jgi:hypothetical protein
MDTEACVTEALRKWRQLSLAQAQGIRTRNWEAVSDCQKGIEQLRVKLDQWCPILEEKWVSAGAGHIPRRRQFRAMAEELAQLEKENQSLLASQRKLLEEKMVHLETTSLKLRRIQSSYAPSLTPAWSSLS